MGSRRSGIVALLLAASVVSVAPAQRTTEFGAMLGGAFSKFRGEDKGDFEAAKVGLAAGAFVSWGVTPRFAVQSELLLVQKGGKNNLDEESFTISYVEVPVLLKYRIRAAGAGSQLSPHAYGGGALAFKIGCTVKSVSTSVDCDAFGSDLKSTDFSLVLGAGLDIGRAMIGARYDLGLSEIEEGFDVKNGTFYLLAGWTFRSPR